MWSLKIPNHENQHAQAALKLITITTKKAFPVTFRQKLILIILDILVLSFPLVAVVANTLIAWKRASANLLYLTNASFF